MNITSYEEAKKYCKFVELKLSTAMAFGGKCNGCGQEYNQSFAFHHMCYLHDEKTYNDFDDTVDYNLYICPIVIKNLHRFRLLCKNCHSIITDYSDMDYSKIAHFYSLSKYLSDDCTIKDLLFFTELWKNRGNDLKKFLKIVFTGFGDVRSKEILDEINTGSLDNWTLTGLDEFFWS